jgi:hypothetical protein
VTWLDKIASWFVRKDPLVAAGERAVTEAERMWALDVIDPQSDDRSKRAAMSRAVIDDCLRAAGWSWQVPYKGDGQVEWCGIYAAACWRAAGINPKWLATFWASTYRLDLWVRYKAFENKTAGTRPAAGGRMLIDLDRNSTPGHAKYADGTPPRAGDVCIVGDGTPAVGDHITLVMSFDARTGIVKTISGNGGGIGPDGKRRHGIVKTDYHIGGSGFRVMRFIRPGADDLIP